MMTPREMPTRPDAHALDKKQMLRDLFQALDLLNMFDFLDEREAVRIGMRLKEFAEREGFDLVQTRQRQVDFVAKEGAFGLSEQDS